MRHGSKVKKFGRVKSQRKALLKSLVSSFVLHGKITSSEVKIKALRPLVEKMITKARKDDLAVKKYLASRTNKEAMRKLISEIGPKFSQRSGGYTRITKMPRRIGDGAKMAILSFVE